MSWKLNPITIFVREGGEGADDVVVIIVATGLDHLDEGPSVGKNSPRRAPRVANVGLHSESLKSHSLCLGI